MDTLTNINRLDQLEDLMDQILSNQEKILAAAVNMNNSKEFLSQKEAAKYASLSERRLVQLSNIGSIKYSRNGNRRIYKKEWIDDFHDKGGYPG